MIKYIEIHTDLIYPITSHGFQGEKYFFTFIDGTICETETFISHKKKNDLYI